MTAAVAALRRNPLHLSYLVVALIIAVLLAVGTDVSDRFLTWRNFSTLFQQMVVLGLASLGQTVAILTGGIDLAIGTLVGTLTVLFASYLEANPDDVAVAIALVLAGGALVGFLNGVLVVTLRVHPLIVTLGTASALLGATLLYRREPGGSVPPIVEDFAFGTIAGIPVPAAALIVIFLAVGIWLQGTRSGRAIYFVGGSPEAARLNGISVPRVLLYAYAVAGLCAGLAAIFLTARTGVGDPRIGTSLTLQSITPVVVGGTVLVGGRGGVLGTLLGVLLVSLINNVLNFMNISSYYQWVVQGLIILAAVGLHGQRRASA